jgi:hypothetical protein
VAVPEVPALSSYRTEVAMPLCGHQVQLQVPVALHADPDGTGLQLQVDELAVRRHLAAHLQTCPEAQAAME